MKLLKLNVQVITLLFSIITMTSCSNDDDNNKSMDPVIPIEVGSNVIVTNTFQSTNFTEDVELPVETLFMVDEGSLAAAANVGNGVEFPSYLLNLYDIDIDGNSINFDVVAEANDPTYGALFRILEVDTYDRYYFTFDSSQNVSGFTASNSSVNLRIDSNNVLVVEIGEGYDFNPDQSFTITLN